MSDYAEILTGTIVDAKTGKPVAFAEVEVYDKDLLVDDHLGAARTDGLGAFRVTFGWSDYKDAFLEDRPDVFLEVKDPKSGRTAKSEVYQELRGRMRDDDTEVLDLGEVRVSF